MAEIPWKEWHEAHPDMPFVESYNAWNAANERAWIARTDRMTGEELLAEFAALNQGWERREAQSRAEWEDLVQRWRVATFLFASCTAWWLYTLFSGACR
jgi:hypothetical protein